MTAELQQPKGNHRYQEPSQARMLKIPYNSTLSSGIRSFSVLSGLRATTIEPSNTNHPKSQSHLKNDEPTVKHANLSNAQKAYLDRAIRVDQAGELGANYIYAGQMFVLLRKHPHLKPILTHMWEQEVHHHNTFNALQLKNRVRPSLLTPFWKVGAIAMGVTTAAISPEAAMACTCLLYTSRCV